MDMPDDYTVANGKIYYLESNALYCYTIDSDSSVKIADSPENSQLIIRDTDYLYLTNWDNEKVSSDNYKVFVMSTNGNIIDTIPIPDCEFFRGGLHNLYIETTDRKVKYLKNHKFKREPIIGIPHTQFLKPVKLPLMNEYIKFITKNTKTPTSLVTACRCFYVYEVLILSNLKARL